MASIKKNTRILFTIAGIVCVLASQVFWLQNACQITRRHLIIEAKDCFAPAYKKEQTYRVPFLNIINSGAVTIESCGTEEVQIIRFCPEPDTVFYSNVTGLSIENFLNRVFVDLREQITPINIDCLADLYSGMLFDKDIKANFVVERFNTTTGEILDSSLHPDKIQPKEDPEMTIVMDISETESLRAVLQIPPGVIFRRMSVTFFFSTLLTVMIIACICFLYAFGIKKNTTDKSNPLNENGASRTFAIGRYTFNPARNELCGFGEVIQLNKKENAILFMLCSQYGNVVERSVLLEENWGKTGIIYTRSLDTYITKLRKHLKKEPSVQILTIKGAGYKLIEN